MAKNINNRWDGQLPVGYERAHSSASGWREHARQREATLARLDDRLPLCRQFRWVVLHCPPKKGIAVAFVVSRYLSIVNA